MLKLTQLIGFGAGRGRGLKQPANAVDYNGSTDYLYRGSGLTGAADSRQGILSLWLRLDGSNGADSYIFSQDGESCRLFRDSSNNLRFQVSDTGVVNFIERSTTGGTITNSSAWRHILLSWDTNHSAGNKVLHFYLDGVDVGTSVADTSPAFDVDYTVGSWSVAATTAGSGRLNGAIAELYFAPGQYLDLTDESNREAFRSSNGKPIDLGPDGSGPTGTAPALYLPNPAATVNVNAGTGGDFTINGSPIDASTSPSD